MPDCGVHYLWFAFVCILIRSPPPPGPPPPPALPMFEADSQTFASAPSVPRGFTLQKFWPAFGGDHRGTLGGVGGPSQTPPPLSDLPSPPSNTSLPPPPICENNAPVRTTRGIVPATFRTSRSIFWFADEEQVVPAIRGWGWYFGEAEYCTAPLMPPPPPPLMHLHRHGPR